jgi:hypothetical protein
MISRLLCLGDISRFAPQLQNEKDVRRGSASAVIVFHWYHCHVSRLMTTVPVVACFLIAVTHNGFVSTYVWKIRHPYLVVSISSSYDSRA